MVTFGLLTASLIGFNAKAQQEVGASGPVITVDKDEHDYGTIEQGANGECFFTVTNTGNQPLIITKCKGSCGCTVPKCTKEPVAPGASTKIKVKYDTNRVGPINKSVTISSNATNEPSKVVRIRGQIKAKPAEPSADKPSTSN